MSLQASSSKPEMKETKKDSSADKLAAMVEKEEAEADQVDPPADQPLADSEASDAESDATATPVPAIERPQGPIEPIVASMARGPTKRSTPEVADLSRVFKNKITKKHHFGSLLAHDRLACGRVISRNLEQVEADALQTWPRCGGCFGTEEPQL